MRCVAFAVVVASCGPVPGLEECRDAKDCAAGQICIVDDGASRCVDKNAVGGGEGEGAVAGEGEGATTGEGEGATAAEGEGSAAGSVVVTGPSFAPTGVFFTVRFENTTGTADSLCVASLDDAGFVPVDQIELASVGAHSVAVTCGSTSSSAATIEGWAVSDFAASSPDSASPAALTVTWTNAGDVADSDIACAIHRHALSAIASPADPADTVIDTGGSVVVLESSDVSVASCAHVAEPSITTSNADIAIVEIAPATPALSLSVTTTTTPALVATATTSGAESCNFVSVDGGFGVGVPDVRAASDQTTFTLHLTAAEVGNGAASPFVVVCTNRGTSSAASSAVVVQGGNVADVAVLANVDVVLGDIAPAVSAASVAPAQLSLVAGNITIDADSIGASTIDFASLAQVAGIVDVENGSNANLFLALGSSDTTTPGPGLVLGGLRVVNVDAQSLRADRLVAVDGDFVVDANVLLGELDLASLASIGGHFEIARDAAALDCPTIASRYCSLTPPRDAAPVVADANGNDCTSSIVASCGL